jgi:hypothetical protein
MHKELHQPTTRQPGLLFRRLHEKAAHASSSRLGSDAKIFDQTSPSALIRHTGNAGDVNTPHDYIVFDCHEQLRFGVGSDCLKRFAITMQSIGPDCFPLSADVIVP